MVQSVGVESPQQVQQQIMGSLQSLNIDALLRHTFIPDYSVRAVTDVVYLVIKRSLHMAAKRATLMEKAQRAGEPCEINENDEEVEKVHIWLVFFEIKITVSFSSSYIPWTRTIFMKVFTTTTLKPYEPADLLALLLHPHR